MSGDRRGAMLGPYELGPELASGASGSVNVAVRRGPLGFRRLFAIKRLHRELARDPDAVAMLMSEARLAGLLAHPLLVPAHDVVDDAGGLAIVVEYVDGLSLSALRTASPVAWPPETSIALAIVRDVLEALAALHAARGLAGEPLGIVHRDVSPKNVVVGADGYSRLIDFGVAKTVAPSAHAEPNGVIGTLAYLAPEQVEGGRVDARADVFAVGVLLWELLTGARAFAETPIATRALSARRLAPPSSLRASVPGALDAVVRRALEAAPEDRFPDARAMSAALDAIAPLATAGRVGAWVEAIGAALLRERRRAIQALGAASVPTTAPVEDATTASIAPRESADFADLGALAATPPPRRRARVRTAWIVSGFALASLLGWLAGRPGPRAAEGALPASTATETRLPTPPAASASHLVNRDARDETPTASARAAVSVPLAPAEPARTLLAAVAPGTTQAPPEPRPRSTGPAVTATAAATAAPSPCAPPYRIDERGVRTFKVECL